MTSANWFDFFFLHFLFFFFLHLSVKRSWFPKLGLLKKKMYQTNFTVVWFGVILIAYMMLSDMAAAQWGIRWLIFFSGRLNALAEQVFISMHSKHCFIHVSWMPVKHCWQETQWVWLSNKRGQQLDEFVLQLCSHDYLFYASTINQTNMDIFRMINLSWYLALHGAVRSTDMN